MRAPLGYSRRSIAVVAILALWSLASCSGFSSKMSRHLGGKVRFAVELDPRLNDDFPLAVDLVVVYDKELYDQLTQLSAAEWFEQRDEYRRDGSPEKLEVTSREWVPPPQGCAECRRPGIETVDYRLGAEGAVIFADYFNPGVHRLVIEPLRPFTLVLGEKSAALGDPPAK